MPRNVVPIVPSHNQEATLTAPIHTAHQPKPRSLAAFIRLCREHADVIITRDDALNAGLPSHLVDRFIDGYLDGRWQVPLRNLIPFIERGHFYWSDIMLVVVKGLRRSGALAPDCTLEWSRIRAPVRKRVVVDLSTK